MDGPVPPPGTLTRFVLLRGLGAIYLVAFLSLAVQWEPLLGARGLTPAARFVARLTESGTLPPTLFVWGAPDLALGALAWVGVVLSAGVLAGLASAPLLGVLWGLYLSFVNVGQVWYGYGWEILLLEAGFLAIWLVPWVDPRPFPALPTPVPVLWLFRWLLFRLMWGAGLIKLRGDDCWRALTCLDTHFETQPLPNPLSPWFHGLPAGVHAAMVAWNHVVELVVPFLCFGPRWLRPWVGVVLLQFQLTLALSGNLSFLNWLTMVLCLSLFEDEHLRRVIPWLRGRGRPGTTPRVRRLLTAAVVGLVAVLSVRPMANLLSPDQAMNRSFDRWHLVNTYGAFGSVGDTRYEVVLQGSEDGLVWRDYEFPCKPGDPGRRPCVIAPFQPRLDWQIWFAAMQAPSQNLWLVHLMDGLLRGEPLATRLLSTVPFPGAPRWIRAERYRYHFARAGEPGWWVRERVGTYVRAMQVDDPLLVDLREENGW